MEKKNEENEMKMNANFKPLLAGKFSLPEAKFPYLASAKLDGIRAIKLEDGVYSRSLKKIPNLFIQKELENLPAGLDGELIVGSPNCQNTFQITTSGVMTKNGTPNFKFFIFDNVGEGNFQSRLARSAKEVKQFDSPFVQIVPHSWVENIADLDKYEQKTILSGYEGVMLRDPDGRYKFGRSTEKEGILLKLKRFDDTEAAVVGFEELVHNGNESEVNELGYTKRSSAKAGQIPGNMLGKLIVKMNWKGKEIEFGIGSGFTQAQRKEIWENGQNYLGKAVKFKYQEIGSKDIPRMPIFLGFREDAILWKEEEK